MAALTPETGTVGRVALSFFEVRNAFNDLQWHSMPLRIQDKSQSYLFHMMARLCSDDMIDPADTRRVLALGLSASQNAPISKTKVDLVRMQGNP